MQRNKLFSCPEVPFLILICLGIGLLQGCQGERPKVLIIGDSISLGYTDKVAELLKDKADVTRPGQESGNVINCGSTGMGIGGIDQWLGDTKWDVIHFNWGLWDICYRHKDSKAYGNRDKDNGEIMTDPNRYEANLRELVKKIKKSGAILVWASTTPVPEAEAGRFAGDEIKYNAIAAKIMAENKIVVNDLHSYMRPRAKQFWAAEGDVHFTKEGYDYLAVKVAAEIECVLKMD